MNGRGYGSMATHLILVILGLLRDHEQLQPLLPDQRLQVSTSSVSLLSIGRLNRVAVLVLLLDICFTDHLLGAVLPDPLHTLLRVLVMTNDLGETWVGLWGRDVRRRDWRGMDGYSPRLL